MATTTIVALIAGRGRYISLFIDHRLKQDGKDLSWAESTQELEQTMASSDVTAGALFQPVARHERYCRSGYHSVGGFVI